MKIAGYVRVSTDSEGQKESPDNQKQMILNFLKEKQHDLYDFYIDVKTGTNDNREGLKRLIEDAENKKFDVIVAKELSRLGRNVELLYQLKRIAETKGIRYKCQLIYVQKRSLNRVQNHSRSGAI